MVSEFDLGWLIGIIDGEGSFILSKHKSSNQRTFIYQPRISITNTNNLIIEEIIRILSELKINYKIHELKNYKEHHKKKKEIGIYGINNINNYLNIVLCKMKCRYNQAIILKNFVELRLSKWLEDSYDAREEEYYQQLKELNSGNHIRSN